MQYRYLAVYRMRPHMYRRVSMLQELSANDPMRSHQASLATR
jgi:hypothetical protein